MSLFHDVIQSEDNRPAMSGIGVKTLFVYLASVIRAWVFLKWILRKFRPEVLFGGWIQRDGFVCALSNYHPFLLMPWGSDALILPFRNRILRIASSFVIQKADKITCDAEEVKKTLLGLVRRSPDDIVVFPWGVEHEIFNVSITGNEIRRKLGWEDKIIVINTRGFDLEYDPMTLVGILPNLCISHPELRVIMCGAGELEEECREFVNSHGLGPVVHFAGYVSQEQLAQYYAAADIFVSCALSDGTSIALLEAMTMGLPVVITEIPAIMEWIASGYNGLFFTPGNGRQLQSHLELIIGDKELRERFSKRNREIAVKRADWEINYGKLETIFQDLTSG
ncbi:MAG: glycosyltransferase [Candidatus Thorarchaeota archaeon]